MWFPYFVVSNGKICIELSEIGGFKLTSFQFNNDQGVQLSIEEYKIGKMFHAIYLHPILVAYKSEIVSEGHNELFDIVDDLLFHHTLVYIRGITFSYFLNIDKVSRYSSLKAITALRAKPPLLIVAVKLLGMSD